MNDFFRGMMKKPGGKLVFPGGKLKKNLRQSDFSPPAKDFQVQKENSRGSRIAGAAVIFGQDRVVRDVDGVVPIEIRVGDESGVAT